ncbi:MAG: ABC transporter permease [Propionibacteriaceae bacterium]|nr:ABC transporter permease [Propionibacteriaceae bacterium]
MTTLKRFAWEIWLPIALLVLWWIVSANSTDFYWPPLSDIMADFGKLWIFDHLVEDAMPSVIRLTIGFVIATVVAVTIGLLLGAFPRLEDATRPIVEILRATPGVALLPIMMLLFGTADAMKVLTIALVATWPILLNTIDGVRSVEPVLHDVATSYRLTWLDRIRFITLPAATPNIFAGMRTALSVAVVAMVVTEMVGAPGGIGYFILDSQRNFNITSMWTGIIALGVIGYLVNKGFAALEGIVLSWHRGMMQHQED